MARACLREQDVYLSALSGALGDGFSGTWASFVQNGEGV